MIGLNIYGQYRSQTNFEILKCSSKFPIDNPGNIKNEFNSSKL